MSISVSPTLTGSTKARTRGPRLVRGQRERLVVGAKVLLAGEIVPDRTVDSLGITRGRRLQVEDQQVDLMTQEFRGLADEVIEGLAPRLVALRHDLDDRNQPVARDMANRHDVLLAAIEVQIRLGRDTYPRPGHDHASRAAPLPLPRPGCPGGGGFSRIVLGAKSTDSSSASAHRARSQPLAARRARRSPREKPLIEHVGDGTDPPLVKVMENPCVNSRPVVDWHVCALGTHATIEVSDPSLEQRAGSGLGRVSG